MSLSFNSKLHIGGCTRDTELFLPHVLANLDKLEKWFPRSKITIFENDSKDKTPKILQEWCKKRETRQLMQQYGLDSRFTMRTVRLAYIRNMLLAQVLNSNFEYMLILDLDNANAFPYDKASFQSCFPLSNEYEVITCNGHNKYNDIWALRIEKVLNFDCWREAYRLRFSGMPKEEAFNCAIGKFIAIMSAQDKPLEVNSAFNGAAFYKISAIKDCCKYQGQIEGIEICEHVPFNLCLKSHGAKIVFNPSFRIT